MRGNVFLGLASPDNRGSDTCKRGPDNRGCTVFGLQLSVRDYPALKEKSKRALKDRYAVEAIGLSVVSTKIARSRDIGI